jgi:hypothetical protein
MTAQRCLRLFEADCSLTFATGDRSHKCYTRTLIVHATVVVYHCCSVRAESDCHTLGAVSLCSTPLIAVVGACAIPHRHRVFTIVLAAVWAYFALYLCVFVG